jgi:hypothetical protein
MAEEIVNSRQASFYESFRSAREEELFRIRRRDGWLKLQLFAQGVIWALSKGIGIGSLQPGTNAGEALSVAGLIACILTLLFYVEDSLVRHLSCFIQDLAKDAEDLNLFEVFDSSKRINRSLRETLLFRFVGQLFTFLVLPLWLTFDRFRNRGSGGWVKTEAIADIIFYAIIFGLLLTNFIKRYRSAPSPSEKKGPGVLLLYLFRSRER